MVFNKHFTIFTFLLFFANALLPDYDVSYHNQLKEFIEIHGPKSYCIILTFQEKDPLITYSPISFQESKNDLIYRCFLPNTDISDLLDNVPADLCSQKGAGVEIVLIGKLLKRVVCGNQILIKMGV